MMCPKVVQSAGHGKIGASPSSSVKIGGTQCFIPLASSLVLFPTYSEFVLV